MKWLIDLRIYKLTLLFAPSTQKQASLIAK